MHIFSSWQTLAPYPWEIIYPSDLNKIKRKSHITVRSQNVGILFIIVFLPIRKNPVALSPQIIWISNKEFHLYFFFFFFWGGGGGGGGGDTECILFSAVWISPMAEQSSALQTNFLTYPFSLLDNFHGLFSA